MTRFVAALILSALLLVISGDVVTYRPTDRTKDASSTMLTHRGHLMSVSEASDETDDLTGAELVASVVTAFVEPLQTPRATLAEFSLAVANAPPIYIAIQSFLI